jgi:hypothetical protein
VPRRPFVNARSGANELEGKPAVRSQVKQHSIDDIASALVTRLRTTNNPQQTTDKFRLQTVGVVHSRFAGLRPLDCARPTRPPHNPGAPLPELAEHGIVLVVAFDDRLRVGGLHRLLEEANLASDARHGAVE